MARVRRRAPAAARGLGGWWRTAQPDGWAAFILTWMIACLMLEGAMPRHRIAVLAGALVGLAMLIKPVYGLFLIPIGIHAMASAPRRVM